MRAAALIAMRELSETFESRSAALRLLVVTLALPLAFTLLLRSAAERVAGDPGRFVQAARALQLQVGFMPVWMAVGGASVSFAAEFEAGTLVPLLAAPVPTRGIFWGKFAAYWLTGIGLTSLSQGVFILLFRPVSGLSWPLHPAQSAIVAGALLCASVPLLAAAIVLASRTRQVRAAQTGIAAFMLPAQLAAVLLAFRVSSTTPITVVAAGTAGLVLSVVLVAVGARMWNREELLGRP